MKAYVIFDVEVNDPAGYEEYKRLATPTVALYGGSYVVRGGNVETLEGGWSPKRIAILKFENMERAKAWLNSPEYRAALELRHQYAVSRVIAVEGVA